MSSVCALCVCVCERCAPTRGWGGAGGAGGAGRGRGLRAGPERGGAGRVGVWAAYSRRSLRAAVAGCCTDWALWRGHRPLRPAGLTRRGLHSGRQHGAGQRARVRVGEGTAGGVRTGGRWVRREGGGPATLGGVGALELRAELWGRVTAGVTQSR